MARRILLILAVLYSICATVPANVAVAQPQGAERRWPIPALVLDQDGEGSCVGAAWANWLMSQGIAPPSFRYLYRRAQVLDQWPGEDYDGTSIEVGGLRAVQEQGYRVRLHRTRSPHIAREWVLTRGPVILSLGWFDSELAPDNYHLPLGKVRGWHAVLCHAWTENERTDGLTCRNSWGIDHGDGGDFRLHMWDMQRMASYGFLDFYLPEWY